MKVFIITEGGRNIGFGHVTRCLSLYEAFEERNITPEFIVSSDEAIKNVLAGKRFRIVNWLKKTDELLSLVKGADIAIADSYLAGTDVYKELSESVKLAVYIDDYNRIEYPKGIVVNGMVYAEEIDYPRRKDIKYLLGPQYIPLRKAFWGAAEKEIKKDVEDVMVTFGGDDKRSMMLKILNFLKKEFPRLTKDVIIGKSFYDKDVKEIEILKNDKINLFYNPDAVAMREIMLKADIAISAGGQTLYELARIGVPTVGICIADNQRQNLEGWQRCGVVEYIGWYNDDNLMEKLKGSIEYMADVNIRKKKSDLAGKLIDGRGSTRVAGIILHNLFKSQLSFRRAKFDDAQEMLNLYNDDAVRENSFNPGKIEWQHHAKWLTERLNDDNCVFFIVNTHTTFYGQVRFDIDPEKKEAVINISLKKDIRGLNLGSFVVNKSINELLKIRGNIKLIRAYIKKGNIPSIKTFERADFKFSEDTIFKNHEAKVYLRGIGHAGIGQNR